jgi:hypothetical protein
MDEPEHVMVYNRQRLDRFLSRQFPTVEVTAMRDANHRAPILCGRVMRR